MSDPVSESPSTLSADEKAMATAAASHFADAVKQRFGETLPLAHEWKTFVDEYVAARDPRDPVKVELRDGSERVDFYLPLHH